MLVLLSLDERPPSRGRWISGFRSGYYHFLRVRHPEWPAMRALAEVYGSKYVLAALTPELRRRLDARTKLKLD